jgi:hypothetical protein
VITTRLPIADLADYAGTSAIRRDPEHCPAMPAQKCFEHLQSRETKRNYSAPATSFGAIAPLTLLASYLTDAYGGDIRLRTEAGRTNKGTAGSGIDLSS